MIVEKYGKGEGEWRSRTSREGYGVGLWNMIWSRWKEFNGMVGFGVRNGRRVRFWMERIPWLWLSFRLFKVIGKDAGWTSCGVKMGKWMLSSDVH